MTLTKHLNKIQGYNDDELNSSIITQILYLIN